MADTTLVNGAQNTFADNVETFYTSPTDGNGTRIEAFTASNNTDSNKTYKAYIYNAAGSALPAVMPLKIVVRNRFNVGAALVGQIIPAGGTLRMESNEALSISFTAAGNEL
jgi:hypothetical protein